MTSKATRNVMRANRSQGTGPEVRLLGALALMGFEPNPADVFGRPDAVHRGVARGGVHARLLLARLPYALEGAQDERRVLGGEGGPQRQAARARRAAPARGGVVGRDRVGALREGQAGRGGVEDRPRAREERTCLPSLRGASHRSA